MSGVVQAVFETISLRENLPLWLSLDEDLLEERISFLADIPETRFDKHLEKQARLAQKNDSLAHAFAKKALQCRDDRTKALQCLNKAYVLASEEARPSILRQRAVHLERLGKHQRCLEDLAELRENLDEELLHVKCRCLVALKEKELAQRCFVDLLKLSEDSAELQMLRCQVEGLEEAVTEETRCDNVSPGFSPSVEVKVSKEKGRHLVAKKNVAAGEVICTDEPKIKMLNAGHARVRCWNCFCQLAQAHFACHTCTEVVYCSSKCRIQADRSYHSAECGLLGLVFCAGIGSWALALRALALTTTSTESLLAEKDLVTHIGRSGMGAPELMKEALVVVFLYRLLRPPDVHSSFDMNLALQLHHFMRVIQFNCHEVTGEEDSSPVIGFAVNPSLALINHSCDSNYGRVWDFRTTSLTVHGYATRPIAAGQEIFDSYSGTFATSDITERREVHQRYLFECDCIACVQQWPTADLLKHEVKRLPASGFKNSSRNGAKELESVQSQVSASNLEANLKLMTLASNVLAPPHRLLVTIEARVHALLRKKHVGMQEDER